MIASSALTRTALVGALLPVICFMALSVAAAQWLSLILVVAVPLGVVLALRAPNLGLLAWLLVGALFYSSIGGRIGGSGVALTPDRLLIALLAGALFLRWAVRPQSVAPFGPIEWSMLSFVTLAVISILATSDYRLGPLTGGLRRDLVYLAQGYAIPFAGAIFAKSLLQSRRDLHRAVVTVMLVGLAVGGLGLVQYVTSTTLLPETSRSSADDTGRVVSTLTAPAEFGMLVAASVFAAIVLFTRARTLGARAFLLAVMAIGLVSAALSETRSVWFGLAVGVVILARFRPGFPRKLLVAGITLVVLAGLSWSVIRTADVVQTRVLAVSPVYNRIALGATALNMATAHPVLGSGFGRHTFATEKWPYITSFGSVPAWFAIDPGVPHNEFLHVLVQLGLVGLVLFLQPFWLSWRWGSALVRRTSGLSDESRDALLLFLAMAGMYVVNGLFVDLAFCTYASNVFYVMLGIVAGIHHRARSGAPPRSAAA